MRPLRIITGLENAQENSLLLIDYCVIMKDPVDNSVYPNIERYHIMDTSVDKQFQLITINYRPYIDYFVLNSNYCPL